MITREHAWARLRGLPHVGQLIYNPPTEPRFRPALVTWVFPCGTVEMVELPYRFWWYADWTSLRNRGWRAVADRPSEPWDNPFAIVKRTAS